MKEEGNKRQKLAHPSVVAEMKDGFQEFYNREVNKSIPDEIRQQWVVISYTRGMMECLLSRDIVRGLRLYREALKHNIRFETEGHLAALALSSLAIHEHDRKFVLATVEANGDVIDGNTMKSALIDFQGPNRERSVKLFATYSLYKQMDEEMAYSFPAMMKYAQDSHLDELLKAAYADALIHISLPTHYLCCANELFWLRPNSTIAEEFHSMLVEYRGDIPGDYQRRETEKSAPPVKSSGNEQLALLYGTLKKNLAKGNSAGAVKLLDKMMTMTSDINEITFNMVTKALGYFPSPENVGTMYRLIEAMYLYCGGPDCYTVSNVLNTLSSPKEHVNLENVVFLASFLSLVERNGVLVYPNDQNKRVYRVKGFFKSSEEITKLWQARRVKVTYYMTDFLEQLFLLPPDIQPVE